MKPLKVVAVQRTVPAKRGRECGECEACCFSCGIHELKKPEFAVCRFQLGGHPLFGCGQYDSRPQSCRDFECAWRQGLAFDGIPPASLRPDKCGVIFYGHGHTPFGGVVIVACEAFPGGFSNEMGLYAMERIQSAGLLVVVPMEGKPKLHGPSALVAAAMKRAERKMEANASGCENAATADSK